MSGSESYDDLRRLVTADESTSPANSTVSDPGEYGTFHRDHQRNPSRHLDPEGGLIPPVAAIDPTSKKRQIVSSLGFCLGAFAMGNALGWSSPALPQLTAQDSPIKLSLSEAGWVGALICLGAFLQGPSTGYLVNRLGRRGAMMASCVPSLLGWLLISAANDVWMLYWGRILTGFSAGSFSVIAPVYIAEIAAKDIRGALGTLFQIMVVAGIFAAYALGSIFDWRTLAGFGAAIPVCLFIGLFFLRDSPASYLLRGRPELARKALVWLRNSAEIDHEISGIAIAAEELRRSRNSSAFRVFCSTDPCVRKPLILSILLMVNQQLSGINAVIVFTASIFSSAGSSLNANVAAMIVGGVQLLATFLSAFVVNKIGRRPTLVWTQAIMTFALLIFGLFFFLKERNVISGPSLGFVPILCLIVFIVAFSFGLGPLAWLMLGELLSAKTAGSVGPVASMVNWLLAFFVTVTFNYLTQSLGDYGTYWLFAGFCVLGIIFTLKCLPETRGKSIEEIQEAFRRS